MIDISKFEVFDFNEGAPYASITTNGITFNKSVIMKMKYPAFVRLLLNPEDKQMAIQTCNESDEKAVHFYKEKNTGVLSVRWNAKDLINTISRVCDWDLTRSSYKVYGTLYPDQSIMLFDLQTATEIK